MSAYHSLRAVSYSGWNATTVAVSPGSSGHGVGEMVRLQVSDVVAAAGWAGPDRVGAVAGAQPVGEWVGPIGLQHEAE